MIDDDVQWRAIREAYAATRAARYAFIQRGDRAEVLARALRDREQRHIFFSWALDYLHNVDSEDMRRAVFPDLVQIVAQADKYFELAQQIILAIDHAWVIANIDAIASGYLVDWEGHSALMWLYGTLADDALLAVHVARCASHPDPGIRELAD